jgi:hypothetical protein
MSLCFNSKYARYKITPIPAKTALVNGLPMATEQAYVAKFEHGAVLPWEAEAALKHFNFKGLAEGVPARSRLSAFDTSWVPEELRERVEKVMLRTTRNGQDFIHVAEPKLDIPFPKYDSLESVEEIVEMLEATGIDPDYVRRYEHENQRRPEVFIALEDYLGAEHTELSERLIEA